MSGKGEIQYFYQWRNRFRKDDFLNALSNYIPKTERVITIEDSAELQITGIENLVSMETRNANAKRSRCNYDT